MRKLVCASLLVVCILTVVGAKADSMNLSLTTTGCFPGLLTCSYDPLALKPGNLTFAGVTDKPNALITTPPNYTVTLGTFTFSDGLPSGNVDATFLATISFDDPDGVLPRIVVGDVSGQVKWDSEWLKVSDSGWAYVDFDNTAKTINFDGGSFVLALNDVSLNIPKNYNWQTDYVSSNWTGTISDVHVVPEPASLTLMGTGLLGLAGYLRRRIFS